MNDFREIIKGAAGQITTDRDIVSEAADRAEQSQISNKYMRKLRPAVCVLIAAFMLCGVSVSAVRYGWLNAVFGTSGDVISENYDRYHLEISEPEIDNRLPDCEIIINEVISDGESMYINLRIENHSGNEIDSFNIYPWYTPFDDSPHSGNYSPGVVTLGYDFTEMCLTLVVSNGISRGDTMVMQGYKTGIDGDNFMKSKYDDYDFRISFNVEEEPEDMSITLTPNKDITFTGGITNGTTVAYVESICISPLSYKIKGSITSTTIRRSDAIHAVMDMEIPVFILTDGTRIPLFTISNGCGGGGASGSERDCFEINAAFNSVLPVDELAGIEFGDDFVEINRE